SRNHLFPIAFLFLTCAVGLRRANAQIPFAISVSYNVYAQQRGLATGDLNGDGLPDIVVSTPNGVAVLINNGDGTFVQPPTLYGANFPSCCASGVVVADFNGVGRPDGAFPASGGDIL